MFALSCALLAPQVAHAQWVVQDSNGNAIPTNSGGSYTLVANATGHTANTYPQALIGDVQAGYADPIWLGCFTPHPFGNPYQNYPYFGPDSSGLMTSSGTDDLIGSVTASNYTTFTYGNVAGTYINASGSYPLNGGVTMDTSAPLFAKFVWSPSTPPHTRPRPPGRAGRDQFGSERLHLSFWPERFGVRLGKPGVGERTTGRRHVRP